MGYSLGYAVCLYFGANAAELNKSIFDYKGNIPRSFNASESAIDLIAEVNAVDDYYVKHFISLPVPGPAIELKEINAHQIRR